MTIMLLLQMAQIAFSAPANDDDFLFLSAADSGYNGDRLKKASFGLADTPDDGLFDLRRRPVGSGTGCNQGSGLGSGNGSGYGSGVDCTESPTPSPTFGNQVQATYQICDVSENDLEDAAEALCIALGREDSLEDCVVHSIEETENECSGDRRMEWIRRRPPTSSEEKLNYIIVFYISTDDAEDSETVVALLALTGTAEDFEEELEGIANIVIEDVELEHFSITTRAPTVAGPVAESTKKGLGVAWILLILVLILCFLVFCFGVLWFSSKSNESESDQAPQTSPRGQNADDGMEMAKPAGTTAGGGETDANQERGL